jgi:hypothetical protein
VRTSLVMKGEDLQNGSAEEGLTASFGTVSPACLHKTDTHRFQIGPVQTTCADDHY